MNKKTTNKKNPKCNIFQSRFVEAQLILVHPHVSIFTFPFPQGLAKYVLSYPPFLTTSKTTNTPSTSWSSQPSRNVCALSVLLQFSAPYQGRFTNVLQHSTLSSENNCTVSTHQPSFFHLTRTRSCHKQLLDILSRKLSCSVLPPEWLMPFTPCLRVMLASSHNR